MNLRQLVGKKVIRTKPVVDKEVVTEGGLLMPSVDKVVEIPDFSFCDCHDTMIEVLDIIQDTPIVKVRVRKGGAAQEFSTGYVRAITGQFDDNNWKDVTEVIDFVDKQNTAIKNDFQQEFMNRMLGVFSGYGKSKCECAEQHKQDEESEETVTE